VDIVGAFLSGVPVYNQFEATSFNGANLWHYDPLAQPTKPGLVEQLTQPTLLGFALDGYPIYGGVTVRSSYRLRQITTRHNWPDGAELTPEQYGPDVTPDNPLGTFAEDYEYAAGSGDLDECNGRFAVTPDYPNGTYAYFHTTTYPYLIGPRFNGKFGQPAPQFTTLATKRIRLSTSGTGQTRRFRLEALDGHGEPIRNFEYVHERPIHLLVASADLAEFDHLHPELVAGDAWEVTHTFAHGGKYRIWADYSLPGEAPHVDSFDITVVGPTRPPQKLIATGKPLRAGEDIPITLPLPGPRETMEPYLGAWAHVIVISENLSGFSHAHPIDTIPGAVGHTHLPAGPAPDAVHIVTNFPSAGLYKMWAQFQLAGQVVTVPYVLRVGPQAKQAAATPIPARAIRVKVTRHGFDPPTLEIPANRESTIAFTRDTTPNCGSEIVFPALGIRQKLTLGGTALVRLPAQPGGEIAFSCGMGMFRGMAVAR
jgi:hypothetical protein